MKKSIFACAALLLLLILQSCSSITVLRTREIAAVQDTLKIQIASLDKKISDQQQQQNELLRLIRADQQVRFSELEQRFTELGSNLSENQYRLSKIYENTSDVQKQLEAKLAADSTAAKTQKSEIEKLFQIASDDFNAGRFDIARSGFQDIATRFSEALQGQESQFWWGSASMQKKITITQSRHFSCMCAITRRAQKPALRFISSGSAMRNLIKKSPRRLSGKNSLKSARTRTRRN